MEITKLMVGDLEKAMRVAGDFAQKAAAATADLRRTSVLLADVEKRLRAIEAQPMPGGPMIRAVEGAALKTGHAMTADEALEVLKQHAVR
jgi:hypothetical protein